MCEPKGSVIRTRSTMPNAARKFQCARCHGDELLESMVGTQHHASKCTGGINYVLIGNELATDEHERVVGG
jgi:hypothetical protein